LVPDEVLIAPPTLVVEILVRAPEIATLVATLPVPDPARARRVQGDFWPIDPHAPDPERTKPKSLGLEPLTKEEEVYQFDLERRRLPVVNEIPPRSECAGGPRPCPLVSCPENNYTSRTSSGALKLTFPHLEPWDVPKELSCSLDLADTGATVAQVAKALNMTEERVRQIQVEAFRKLRTTRVGREWLRSVRGG
jgi:hypothetical protein